MRMAFGLVSLLVTVGVLIMIFHYIEAPAIQKAGQTKKKVENWAGSNTSQGLADAKSSIDLEEITSGGKFNGFLVKSITPGGPMATDFGLLAGDQIVGIGGLRMRDDNDSDLSRAQIFEAKIRNQPLNVIRNNQQIELRAKGL